jgi:hypothetical protein
MDERACMRCFVLHPFIHFLCSEQLLVIGKRTAHLRKLMLEDLVKETEVIARAEVIRRSLSEETLHEREIKAVSAPSTDHQSLISPPPAGAPNT